MRSRFPLKFLPKVVLRTPDLIFPLLKMEYRKQKGVEADYARKDGLSLKFPRQISLRITNACNHRCAVCGQYGSKGYIYGEKGKELLKTLPYQTYKNLVDEVAKYKPLFYVTGGEPFLYPDFVKLMNYIKQKGCILTVVTNGVKLAEYAEEIVKNSWDMVLVSFDGPEDIHDNCRGVKGAYRTAISGLAEIVKKRKELKKSRPYIFTSLTLSGTNVEYIDKTFELNKNIMPDLAVVYLSWFTSSGLGDRHAKILKEELGVDAYTWRSYAKEFKPKEAKNFADNLERARKKRWPFNYIVIPDLKPKEVYDYYLYPEKTFGYSRCAAPFIMVDIMPNGDVTTCRDFIDIKIGNICENSLMDIWNSDKFVKFRKLLIKYNGLLPQCTRCCGLMGF